MEKPGNKIARCLFVAAAVVMSSALFTSCSNEHKNQDEQEATKSVTRGAAEGIPSLIDLGRTFCIPCKLMAPILEELKKEYAGRLHVEFIDVGDNPGAARKYRIRMIPTQIFLDASGKELYRHVGFFSKEDILKKCKELGIKLEKGEEGEKTD